MSGHTTDSIIRIAMTAGGPLILGEHLTVDSVLKIIMSTSAPITIKAGARTTETLIRMVTAGGPRVTIDFS